MEKTNNSERAKAIIKAFEQLSVEEMEKVLIELKNLTDKRIGGKDNGSIRKGRMLEKTFKRYTNIKIITRI